MTFETMSTLITTFGTTVNPDHSTLNVHPEPSSDLAISVCNVSKMYPLYAKPSDRLKQSLWYALPEFLRGRPRQFYREFWALHDLSFEIKRGEALGIIGRNGSGKSTLLQIIAGTLTPTTGEVQVNGRVAALLELGSGFNAEFTGRENVYLNGAILGFSREEMDERFDEIAAFADIGDFMDQPVKFYSSGMFVRLAFAVQACVEPDVLIVDEALSVGDIFFQQKCHARMEELLARNTAIIIVSHDMNAITKYSTETLLLTQGQRLFLGQPNEAVYRYLHQMEMERLFEYKAMPASPATNVKPGMDVFPFEFGSIPDWPLADAFLDLSQAVVIGEEKIAHCTGIAVCNEQKQPCITFQTGEIAYFYYEFELLQDIEVPIGGVDIANAKNMLIYGANSLHHLTETPLVVRKGTHIRFQQAIELTIQPGEYTFTIGLATISATDYLPITQRLLYDYPTQKVVTILRVGQVGRLLIRPRTQGITVPFHGYVNLKGMCILSVYNQHK